MEYCIKGYLDTFVEPSPGGWGLPTTILSWLNTNKRMTHVEVWQAIQDSELEAVVKALETEQIKTIMDWMFSNGMIGKPGNESITYTS